MNRLAAAYRRTGADVPGGDPRPTHGAEMEGWFWRVTDPVAGRVVIALCGVNHDRDGRRWATVALAAHPGGFVRSLAAPTADADAETYRVEVPGTLTADEHRLHVDLGPDARLDLRIDEAVAWPLRTAGGGVFSVLPFLGQYWHPHVLDARVEGEATVGAGPAWTIDPATSHLYAEKNWGRGFPELWWWGQAHGFARPDVAVAFTGGVLEAGPVAAVVGGIVVRLGGRVLRLTPPLARMAAEVGDGRWWARGRSRGIEVEVEGHGAPADAHVLPVPVPAERRNEDTDFEHLAGHLRLVVRERGRVLFEGTSDLAGLEVGYRPGHPQLAGLAGDALRIRSSSITPRRSKRVLGPVRGPAPVRPARP